MAFGMWDTLFNLLVLAFWLHAWLGPSFAFVAGPYLGALARLTRVVVGFLRPAFLVLNDRAIAVLSVGLLLALRAFSAPRTDSGWVLRMGFEWRQAAETHLTSFLAFSLISLAIFLFKLWGVSMLFLRADAEHDHRPTVAALQTLSFPFVRLPVLSRPLALILFGMLIVAALGAAGNPTHLNPYAAAFPAWLPTPSLSPEFVLHALLCALRGWVDVLGLLVQLMLAVIIGSWVGMLTGAPGIALACREWTDLFLGPLRRFPLRIGMLDLSPIVFIVVIGLVQGVLHAVLMTSYQRLAEGAW